MTTVLEIDKPQVGLSTNSGNSVLINDFMKANRYGRGERKKAMVVKNHTKKTLCSFLVPCLSNKKEKRDYERPTVVFI